MTLIVLWPYNVINVFLGSTLRFSNIKIIKKKNFTLTFCLDVFTKKPNTKPGNSWACAAKSWMYYLFIYLFFILILLSSKFKKLIGFYFFSQFIWFVSKLLPTSTSYVRIITALYWNVYTKQVTLENSGKCILFFSFTLDFGKKRKKKKTS